MLLATVGALQRAAQGGALPRALHGKHLCVLGRLPDGAGAAAFRDAARELGAQVTALDPERLALASDHDVVRCGRMLGMLYDAVECEGVPSALVDGLRASAGVPVYDGLALDAHPTACLRETVRGASPDEQRRRVLQAVLVAAIGQGAA